MLTLKEEVQLKTTGKINEDKLLRRLSHCLGSQARLWPDASTKYRNIEQKLSTIYAVVVYHKYMQFCFKKIKYTFNYSVFNADSSKHLVYFAIFLQIKINVLLIWVFL